jgi:DNA-binding response OmpR family regulator
MGDSTNRAVRILVIDPDLETSDHICRVLLNEGYQCEHTSSAARALVLTRNQLPALMIVHTQLDACSGFDFVRTVRCEYPRQELPVIYVSQSSSPEIVTEARNAGGIYFLSKPIDPSVLLELVDKSLWMPHLIRRHIDNAAHQPAPKAPRVFADLTRPLGPARK